MIPESARVIPLVIENHPHRSLADFGRKLVGRLASHGSTFSGVGASDKPGAVHSEIIKCASEPFLDAD